MATCRTASAEVGTVYEREGGSCGVAVSVADRDAFKRRLSSNLGRGSRPTVKSAVHLGAYRYNGYLA